jgi:hypothetical protein
VRIRSAILCAVAGAAWLGWLGWPAPEPAPGAVDIAGPCSAATRQWAETWRHAPAREPVVARVSVLCRADGTAYATTLVYVPSAHGPRLASWRPVTTFFEMLSAHAMERVEIFDQSGRLAEYATVDRETGHLEFYSAASRPTGAGSLDRASGRVDRVGPDGRRRGSLSLPIPSGVAAGG